MVHNDLKRVDAYYQTKRCDDYEQGAYHGARKVLVNLFSRLEQYEVEGQRRAERRADKTALEDLEKSMVYKDFKRRAI